MNQRVLHGSCDYATWFSLSYNLKSCCVLFVSNYYNTGALVHWCISAATPYVWYSWQLYPMPWAGCARVIGWRYQTHPPPPSSPIAFVLAATLHAWQRKTRGKLSYFQSGIRNVTMVATCIVQSNRHYCVYHPLVNADSSLL